MPQNHKATRTELGCPQLQPNHISQLQLKPQRKNNTPYQGTFLVHHIDFYNFYSGASSQSRGNSSYSDGNSTPASCPCICKQAVNQHVSTAVKNKTEQIRAVFTHPHQGTIKMCFFRVGCHLHNVSISRLTQHQITIQKLLNK